MGAFTREGVIRSENNIVLYDNEEPFSKLHFSRKKIQILYKLLENTLNIELRENTM